MSDHERTEEPSPRKLLRAREQGEVPQSRLATAALVLLGVGAAIALGAEGALRAWGGFVEALLVPQPMAPGHALAAAADVAAVTLMAPLAAAVGLGALGGFLQVGPLWTWRPVAPDLGRLDPARGLARMFSPAELAPRVGALALVVLLLSLAAWVLGAALPGLLGRVEPDPRHTLGLGGAVLGAFSLRACALVALAGAVGLVYRRTRHQRAQRMSRRELRQEQREAEGEPQARRRRAELHREGALGPTVEEALVGAAIVVRGGDRAVALQWEHGSDGPPRVALAARGGMASRLVLLASRAGVPAVLDESLARELERPAAGGLPRPWLVRLARHLALASRRAPPALSSRAPGASP